MLLYLVAAPLAAHWLLRHLPALLEFLWHHFVR